MEPNDEGAAWARAQKLAWMGEELRQAAREDRQRLEAADPEKALDMAAVLVARYAALSEEAHAVLLKSARVMAR